MIRYVSFGSVLPLLRNFSSRFAAILFYFQFLSLPLCGVSYVWSLTVDTLLKIINFIFQFLQCYRLQSFIWWKYKKHFSTFTYIKHIPFPKGSTKNIKISTSNKGLSTAAGNKKKGIVSTLIDWLNFCSDVSFTSLMVIVSKISFRKIAFFPFQKNKKSEWKPKKNVVLLFSCMKGPFHFGHSED